MITGRRFYKMSGSGNDFVFVDARTEPAEELAAPAVIQRLCARGTGIGADGLVLLEPPEHGATLAMRYFNSDGSLAALCGNATLCTTRLSVELGAADPTGLSIETGSGTIRARIQGGLPEIDLPAVRDIRAVLEGVPTERGDERIGYAVAGVPHIVILCDDPATVDVVGRGRPLRQLAQLQPEGANVNFVGRGADGVWVIRTYERGVEAETLACGTGAVATAALLAEWGESGGTTRLRTRSGRELRVRLQRTGDEVRPSLAGEGRIVFQGELGELE